MQSLLHFTFFAFVSYWESESICSVTHAITMKVLSKY